jgi:hypothetical protein
MFQLNWKEMMIQISHKISILKIKKAIRVLSCQSIGILSCDPFRILFKIPVST